MKPVKTLLLVIISFIAFAIGTHSSKAATKIELQRIRNEFLSVPAPELPTKAPELIAKAKLEDREAAALA